MVFVYLNVGQTRDAGYLAVYFISDDGNTDQ